MNLLGCNGNKSKRIYTGKWKRNGLIGSLMFIGIKIASYEYSSPTFKLEWDHSHVFNAFIYDYDLEDQISINLSYMPLQT